MGVWGGVLVMVGGVGGGRVGVLLGWGGEGGVEGSEWGAAAECLC